MDISVVVPVYRAEECLDELYARLTRTLEAMQVRHEIILVEDCGGDDSWKKIEQIARTDPRVRGFQFSRNFGQHYGITAGIEKSRGEWVVVMDCDLQDRPEEIPRLYDKALEGFPVVIALRGRRNDPWLKRISSRLFFLAFNYLSELDYNAEAGNFRIISRKVADEFICMREHLRMFGGLVTWMGFDTAYITVQHAERFAGDSSYSFGRLIKLAADTIVAYSDKPLRLAIKVGVVIALLSFIVGLKILWDALFHGTAVMGWSSLMVSIYFLGGVILAFLGMIGLYLGKVFDQVKNRPLYIIAKSTDDPTV